MIAGGAMGAPGSSQKSQADIWHNLTVGLDVAYARQEMASSRYMELYTTVYDYCTAVTLATSNNNIARRFQNRQEHGALGHGGRTGRTSNPGAEFVGHDMYDKLKTYVTKYVANVREKGTDLYGEELLEFYTKEWSNFRVSSKVMDGIFAYLNRHWIRRELDEGHDDVYMIYTLALTIWKDHMYGKMKDRVTDAVLELIKRERLGEVINKSFVSGVVECLVELGIDEHTADERIKSAATNGKQTTDKLKVYRDNFETKFLQATKEFYAQESTEFLLQGGTVTDYMRRVERRLAEESTRCSLYLHDQTSEHLAKTCEEVLITTQLEMFQNAFSELLEKNQDDDLGRMYKLCERVDHGLDNLRSALERHITKEGQLALDKVSKDAFNDARLYITTLLDVHSRYAKLVLHSFRNEPGFLQALDKAATNFINQNAVTSRAPASMANSKSAELLARYCDQLLRKSAKNAEEADLEETLQKIMIVFKYIEDKDVFSKYYTKLFSKRLINELSSSDEAEASLITKLKNMCGYEYTTRLSKMVNDTQVSKDLCNEFKTKMTEEQKSVGLDFNILVLSSGSWPTYVPMPLNLPAKLNVCIEHFTDFYNEKHNGRRLTWIYSQSRGEINSLCFAKKYLFTATTAQMAVMMLYNDQDSFSMQAILEATKMEPKSVSVIIVSLIKNDILKSNKEPNNDELAVDAVLALNMSYANKKVKVDLSKLAARPDVQKETVEVQKNVEDDRKAVIDAAIVRIMKTRKRISHAQLMSEVIQQLSVRFKPKVDMIKRCIGYLIDKEYMSRAENQRDVYEYIA